MAQAERLRDGYRYSMPSGGQPPGIRRHKKVEKLAKVMPVVNGKRGRTDGRFILLAETTLCKRWETV